MQVDLVSTPLLSPSIPEEKENNTFPSDKTVNLFQQRVLQEAQKRQEALSTPSSDNIYQKKSGLYQKAASTTKFASKFLVRTAAGLGGVAASTYLSNKMVLLLPTTIGCAAGAYVAAKILNKLPCKDLDKDVCFGFAAGLMINPYNISILTAEKSESIAHFVALGLRISLFRLYTGFGIICGSTLGMDSNIKLHRY